MLVTNCLDKKAFNNLDPLGEEEENEKRSMKKVNDRDFESKVIHNAQILIDVFNYVFSLNIFKYI